MTIVKRELTVRFLTPTFLGNAEQVGQWRTPPFKALLRQWWRVAWAEANNWSMDHKSMRTDEGELFGAAAEGSGNRSRVRMRLDRWDEGKMGRWDLDPTVFHKEVGKDGKNVGSHLYLGFGPLNSHKGTFLGKKDENCHFKPHPAIQAGETAELCLAFPEADALLLDRALALMHTYGTLGGRSRNGWGSFALAAKDDPLALDSLPLRDWRDCLDRDWPHAIGRDASGPLIWQTGWFDDWQGLMHRLAEIKIGLRRQQIFGFRLDPHAGDKEIIKKGKVEGIEHGKPQLRHWLSYPVTNHVVSPWNKSAKSLKLGNRLPNSLRYKVREDSRGRLHGVIFHVPCLPPPQFGRDPQAIKQAIVPVWEKVHAFLDAENPSRITQ